MLLDPEQMIETISNTTGNSVAFQYSAPRILARDFDGIRMDITYKDVELQTSLAKSLGMPMFMAPTGLQVQQMGRAMGLGDKDGAAIVQLYEAMDRRAGCPSRMSVRLATWILLPRPNSTRSGLTCRASGWQACWP